MVVVPGAMPVTTPPEMVATDGVELLHVPPGVGSDKVIVAPAHNDVAPAIGAAKGAAVTVTLIVAVALPQILVTV